MTIEITRQDGAWIYRISPTDPLLIERRPVGTRNKHGCRWYWYLRRDSVNEAKAALLAIGKEVTEGKG